MRTAQTKTTAKFDDNDINHLVKTLYIVQTMLDTLDEYNYNWCRDEENTIVCDYESLEVMETVLENMIASQELNFVSE